MSVVPRERGGAGGRPSPIPRARCPVALGVAVLGSVLAQAYRSQLSPHLAFLPASSARNGAAGSITASQAVAARLGAAGRDLAGFADTSFVHAMHITTLISAAITLPGAVVVLRWMPGRTAATPAQQPPAAPSSAAEQVAAEQVSTGQAAAVRATPDYAVAPLAAAHDAGPVIAAEG